MGIPKSGPSEEVLCRLNEFRKSGEFCDVKLIVEGVEFRAHRNVLAAFSPYFKAMFSGSFAEAEQNDIQFEAVELSIMECLLEYAYTGKIEITPANVPTLLHASNFLQVGNLSQMCWVYVKSNINTGNCIGIHNLSDTYSRKDVNYKAKEFILNNFLDVCQEIEFLELAADKIIDLIDDGGLIVDKEERVFDAVLQWFHYKQNEREEFLPKVISHVRLTNLDPYFLHTRLKTTEALMKSESCMKLFLDVFSYQCLPNRRSEIQIPSSTKRVYSPYVEVLLVTGNSLDEVGRIIGPKNNFCVSEDGRMLKSLQFPKYGCDLSTVNTTSKNELYYVDDNNKVALYDYKSDQWNLMQFYCELSGRAVLNLDGRWYTFSMVDSNSEIEYLDETIKGCPRWQKITPMLEQVHNPNVVSIDGIVYIVGGKTKNKTYSQRLQRYDPFNKSWSMVSSLPAPWTSLEVCALNRKIYVFSDNSSGDSLFEKWQVDVYNVSSNQWETCSQLPKKFENHTLLKTVAYRGNIYVLIEKDDERCMQIYSPTSDSWSNFEVAIPAFQLSTLRGRMLIAC